MKMQPIDLFSVISTLKSYSCETPPLGIFEDQSFVDGITIRHQIFYDTMEQMECYLRWRWYFKETNEITLSVW